MKKSAHTLIFFSIAIFLICLSGGCSKTSSITACIGTLPSSASAGVPVSFTSCTSGASSYSWSFGDGGTGSGASTSHTYATAGTYNGSLTVTSGSSSNSKTFTITVVNNSWSFKGTSFTADSVVGSASGNDLTAYGVSGSNKDNLVFVFPTLPTAGGAYTVININNAPPVGQQLYVTLYSYAGSAQAIYGSTGSGAVTATVSVSGGKITVTLPTIEVANAGNVSDSTSLSATVTQTQ